ncbi:hypothetical protein KL914_000006 [Ogataea haglerorum]|nr:hypothetical protein KL914_000006 [Ogataea haglerorum]
MDKTVYLVVGASRGLGYEIANQLSSKNSNYVITTYRSVENSGQLLSLAEKPNVEAIQLDIAAQYSIDNLPHEIRKFTDAIDIAIISAGIAESFGSVLECSRDIWLEHYTTNALGPILVYQKIHPFMLTKFTRKVFFISCAAGSAQTLLSIPFGAYGQSKAALNYSVKKLSEEQHSNHFTIVAIHPGTILTENVKEKLKFGDIDVKNKIQFKTVLPALAAEQVLVAVDILGEQSDGRFVKADDLLDIPF